MKLILDIETTRFKNPITGKDDPSPYNPSNSIVTVQVKVVGSDDKTIYVFNHKENTQDVIENHNRLQQLLSSAELVIGHNLKFDMSWLYECGFHYSGELYDTMIFEYVCAKGMKQPMGLKDIAIKYGLPLKLDILQEYWDKGVNTNEVPLAELTEYALQDIETTYALYLNQRERYRADNEVKFMWKAIKLSNEALEVIIEMERNGISIDQRALAEVEQEYIKELSELERGIKTMSNELMGDTPVNLASPDDMSTLLYGFEVKDKKLWAQTLGIGSSERNSVKKKKIPRRVSPSRLKAIIAEQTTPVYRTTASHCTFCHGNGKIRRVKKDGGEWKKETLCKECDGCGFTYISTGKKAGLRLKPISSQYATAAGFAADKKVIESYLRDGGLKEDVKAFLAALQRYSAITTYLSTFIDGIRNNIREDLLLHTSLNQAITATGRLSSSNPNFQNLPRGATFPVRKAIKSRFEGGYIYESDFSGLEYRIAVMLAKCPVGLASIVNGKDRHQITAEILFNVLKSECDPVIWKGLRQAAKAHSFKPLYGGETGTEDEMRYYQAFLEEHTGIRQWQTELCDTAIAEGQIDTFTGRIFAFPNAYRQTNGRVKGKTQIVNYPVQSVATADIIWLVICDIFKAMKKAKVKSKLILQVHDAVILDVHPEEKEEIIGIVKKSFDRVHELMYDKYGYTTEVPLSNEMSIGANWGDKIEIHA